jgi:tRNA threonylcarbamoyladenosine biosynthesis protein TsaB
MILTIRTDKPEAELGLFDNQQKVAYETWHAHRQLAETIHQKLQQLLDAQGRTLSNITGIVVYKGPGSFTGLRIGISVANALAYSLDVPLAAETGDDWIPRAMQALAKTSSKQSVVPEYGAPVRTTEPRK